jgi:cytidyltransferase-like protein
MQVHSLSQPLPAFRNAVVTIGTFDGVHRGHRLILDRMRSVAEEVGGETVIITFDIKNAFGTMPRSLMLEGILKHCEELAPLFLWAYGGPASLVNNERRQVAVNATGCRQGDPLAGLYFCLGLQDILEEAIYKICQKDMVFSLIPCMLWCQKLNG